MTNFPIKLKPHYAKKIPNKKARTVVTKDTLNKMIEIIRKAKTLRDNSNEYQNGNLSL